MPELTQGQVELWVEATTGDFSIRGLHKELELEDSERAFKHLRTILSRLKKTGLIESVEHRGDGWFRKVYPEAPDIDLVNANENEYIPIKLPFEMHKYALIRPKSLMVITGDKSAGKTAFIHNLLKLNLNMNGYNITLFDTQIGAPALKARFLALGIPIPPPFKVKRLYQHFADPVSPDDINIIDFVRVDMEKTYLIANELAKISQKLDKGIAIVGLQKPPGRDIAYGGAGSAFDVDLYVSISYRKVKIVYCKNPAKPTINPENMTWTFGGIKNGVEFLNPQLSPESKTEFGETENGFI